MLAVLVAVFGIVASPAWAAEFVVDRKDDPDPTTADDCTPGTDDDCSLRGAVIAANGATGADTITIPRGTYTLMIAAAGGTDANDGTTGDLDILDDVTITGAGARSTTVTGGEGFDDRIFDVPPEIEGDGDVAEVPSEVVAEISGVTISGGNVLNFGGGVRNAGAGLTLDESTVSGNSSGGDGGGIRNDGVLSIARVTVSDNTSEISGGGIANDGEFSFPPPPRVADSGELEGPGDLEITNSTVSGNTSAEGGGVLNFNGGDIALTNVTLTDNTAQPEQGGNFSSENVSASGNGGKSGIATFKNTIVANPQGGSQNCVNSPGSTDSLGNNLDDDGSCDFDEPSDIIGENPRLGPLQNNGGPTDTHALSKKSPTIDEGDDSACPNRDQRGVKRQDGDGNGSVICDIGAYEFKSNTAPVAVNDRYTTNEGQPIAPASPGVLVNDRDSEGDQLTARLVERPKHGRLEFDEDGSFTYTPDRNFGGTDFFSYRASDGPAESNTARVRILVRG